MPRVSPLRAPPGGFSLAEVVIVLAVLALVVGLLAPNLAGLIQGDKERATQREAEPIYRAIFGSLARGEFGYLGDMGRLPASLDELVTQGTQPAFHTADGATPHVGRVGTGWRGPYLRSGFATPVLFTDAWGQPLGYAPSGPTAGQIVSGGMDGNPTSGADNIVFPVHAPATTGTLFIALVVNQVPNPVGATVRLYSPVNGEQTLVATRTSTDAGFDGFRFDGVPQGLHALSVTHSGRTLANQCVTVTRELTAAVQAGRPTVKEVGFLTSAQVLVTTAPCP